jgi:hypothetical protein
MLLAVRTTLLMLATCIATASVRAHPSDNSLAFRDASWGDVVEAVRSMPQTWTNVSRYAVLQREYALH